MFEIRLGDQNRLSKITDTGERCASDKRVQLPARLHLACMCLSGRGSLRSGDIILAVRSIVSGISYGVPRFVGALFRTTKLPSSVILIGAFGVPVLLGLTLTIASMASRSGVPMKLLPIGILQFQSPEIQAQAGPDMLKLLHTMTPAQLAWGRHIAEFLMIDSIVVAIAIFWWCVKLGGFLSRHKRRKH
jgi:hypothetical protein